MTTIGILLFLRRDGGLLSPFKPPASTTAPPQNSQAYELYLRGLSYKYEFPENRQAIGLLERSTALDPNSARSWYELARRYDIEFINAGRGRGFLEQALEANRHALKLAPAFSPARLQEVMLEVQGGQLISAYHSAVAQWGSGGDHTELVTRERGSQ
jgi:tetratricopeptide (TPR) repeat protein